MKHRDVHLLLNSCSSFLPSLTFLHAIKGPDKDMMPQKTRLIKLVQPLPFEVGGSRCYVHLVYLCCSFLFVSSHMPLSGRVVGRRRYNIVWYDKKLAFLGILVPGSRKTMQWNRITSIGFLRVVQDLVSIILVQNSTWPLFCPRVLSPTLFGLYDFWLVETCSWPVCDLSVTGISASWIFFALSPAVHGKV